MKHKWTFPARFKGIVNGSTLIADIDLGFCKWLRHQRITLWGIKVPRLRKGAMRGAGVKSKFHLQDLIIRADRSPRFRDFKWSDMVDWDLLWIDSKGKDKYGRWIAVVYTKQFKPLSINDQMIRDGFATEYYPGEK